MSFVQLQRNIIPRPILFVFVSILLLSGNVYAQPVEFAILSSSANDTFFVGYPATLSVTMNSGATEVGGLRLPLVWSFTNGNIVGPLADGTHVFWSPKAATDFETYGWYVPWGADVTDPDSTNAFAADFDLAGWLGAGELLHITFVPFDTGSIGIDTIHMEDTILHSIVYPEVVDRDANPLPVSWSAKTLTVLECPVLMTGDVNQDGVITSADVITTVLAVFICDFGCIIPCWAAGDTNCNGSVTSADIIVLVNYIFKGGDPPCDVCPLIWDGTWSCP